MSRHLRRCLELARAARDGGNEPFGSLLVDGGGIVVAELTNTVGTGDVTGHPELALAAWASLHMTADERTSATLYTSCESCAMCAGGQYWAGIGRLVFALSRCAARSTSSRRMVRLCDCRVVEVFALRQHPDRRCGTVRGVGGRGSPVFDGVLVNSVAMVTQSPTERDEAPGARTGRRSRRGRGPRAESERDAVGAASAPTRSVVRSRGSGAPFGAATE